jgi:hypothetical protein
VIPRPSRDGVSVAGVLTPERLVPVRADALLLRDAVRRVVLPPVRPVVPVLVVARAPVRPELRRPLLRFVVRRAPVLRRAAVLRFAVLRLAVARLAGLRFAVVRLAVLRLAVARLAVLRFAVARLAVLRFAVARLAVARLAVLRFAVARLAVLRLAVLRVPVERFAVLRFAVLRRVVPPDERVVPVDLLRAVAIRSLLVGDVGGNADVCSMRAASADIQQEHHLSYFEMSSTRSPVCMSDALRAMSA